MHAVIIISGLGEEWRSCGGGGADTGAKRVSSKLIIFETCILEARPQEC